MQCTHGTFPNILSKFGHNTMMKLRFRYRRPAVNLACGAGTILAVLLLVIYEENIQLFFRYNNSPFRAIWTPDSLSDFKEIDFEATIQSNKLRHGCHAFIFSVDKRIIFNNFPARAKIMMHMRIDGYMGFPGGERLLSETPEEALNRELREELAFDTDRFPFTRDEHSVSYVNTRKKFVDHLFVKRVSDHVFQEIETNMTRSRDYGIEIFGPIRVPLFTLEDGYRGFPNFMTNKFVGNSLQELLNSILKTGIMSESEMKKAIKAVNNSSINLQLQIPTF